MCGVAHGSRIVDRNSSTMDTPRTGFGVVDVHDFAGGATLASWAHLHAVVVVAIRVMDRQTKIAAGECFGHG
jgi:voltage-gated potassium channel Kch